MTSSCAVCRTCRDAPRARYPKVPAEVSRSCSELSLEAPIIMPPPGHAQDGRPRQQTRLRRRAGVGPRCEGCCPIGEG
eukprot:scaffold5608_cov386-Prasinococcus_capsulatus_cf.AAC.8